MTFKGKQHQKDGSSPQMDTCMSYLRHDACFYVTELDLEDSWLVI